MDTNGSEACGRCGVSSVVEMTTEETDSDGEDGSDHDPYGDEHITVSESELRVVAAPAAVLSRVRRMLDAVAVRVIHGRDR